MNINESLRDWINDQKRFKSCLTGVPVVTMGDDDSLTPPFIAVYESGSSTHETGPTVMLGVTDFEISVELHTVPVSTEDGGTPPDTERLMRRAIYEILNDGFAIEWINGRNGWRVFDIRLSSPTTEPQDGRRISKWSLTVIACPIT